MQGAGLENFKTIRGLITFDWTDLKLISFIRWDRRREETVNR
jgi:hypothetical protein